MVRAKSRKLSSPDQELLTTNLAPIMRSIFYLLLVSLLLITIPGWSQDMAIGPNPPLNKDFELLDVYVDATIFDNQRWCYLRFSEVPSDQQKAELESAGVNLYQYQPDLEWFASMPTNLDTKVLKGAGVVKAFVKPWRQKIDHRIPADKVPAYAEVGGKIEATIVVASTDDYAEMTTTLEQGGVTVISTFEPLGFLKVSASQTALITTAKQAFVIYVELPEPPAELEIEDEISMTRGAYVNGYYNGNGITGDGITIAVNEGGIVDTIWDPSFKNRIDRSLESGTVSGHKTGVSWRMASAGNINPVLRGHAFGATLMSGGINFTNAAQANVNIVNNSFGYGCIPAGPTYNSGAATNDFLVRSYNRFMITYSCGNMGASSCANYGAGPGWGNITGLVKSGKNIFAVGAMNPDDQLTGFSSRGPAMDGRILPDITATGPGGTSHASPNLAGVNAMLTEAYRNVNSNQWPNSGLIKGIILNSADDIENPGPDFKTGFGRINARRALEVIDNSQFVLNSVANGAVTNNTIAVPAGVSRVKISIYWNDREATPGITGKTLVNDLDLRVQDPNGTWTQPWILNPFPDPDSLNLVAFHGTDTLNNVELVTIDNPTSGNYTVEVSGTLVPFGPQFYHVIYSFVYDSITVIYPHGGEGLVPGENRRIRWDAFDTGQTFDIEFSNDSGMTWQPVVSGLASDIRSYNWTIPNSISGNCLVKVKTNTQEDISQSRFTIVAPPANLNLAWRCADSALIAWDSVPGALGYRVTRLGNKYMDFETYSSDPYTMIYNLSSSDKEWVSVQTILPDSGTSRRAIAIEIAPGDFNCIGADVSLAEIVSPSGGYFPSCLTNDSLDLKLKLKNTGTASLTFLPIAYQINGGTIAYDTLQSPLNSAAEVVFTIPSAILFQTGTNTLTVWTNYPGDANSANDTLQVTVEGYVSSTATFPYVQDFDNFINCSTAWGCASITCNLSLGWYNLPNQIPGDSIDWRTNDGGTGSGGTGPSADHTTGNGKYLYLEGSGNSGSGCQNKEAHLHSPCFDLTGTNQPTVSYWYHAFGGAIGSLHLDVLADGQWYLNIGPSVVGAQGNQWLQGTADLSAFSGQKVVVRLRGFTGGGWASDLAVDDINLTTLPLANFETSLDTFCLGQPVPLQNLTTYGNSYNWSVVQNTFTYSVGNGTSTNPTILPNDTGWYDVQLIATNASGNDTLLIPQLFYVGSFNDPTLVSDAPGNAYCIGDTATFTANGPGGNYTFYYNGIPVQSGSSTTWTTTQIADGDSVWVENQVNSQCVLSSPATYITVQAGLQGTVLLADDADLTICEGDTVVFSTQPGLSQYVFHINTTPTQSGPDSLFETDQLSDGDFVYVQISDSIGCPGFTDTLTWTVLPVPATPMILPVGNDSLQASVTASSYQWWRDAQLLPDVTQVIWAQSNGNYTVQAIDAGCASEVSAGYEYTMVGLEELTSDIARIFPNPTRGQVHLLLEKTGYNQLTIHDKTGRLVLTQSVEQGLNSLRINQLSAGVYVLRLQGEKGSRAFMLVVE